ncbi:MAG: hypothetical protein E4G71_01870 [Candidatus Atribacteria bacterium]|nr:MAG: hypothetical protein E4G71_01870 [Candidatus Atribacteria bacterium]
MQRPGVLTTFGQSDYNNNIYLSIRDLTPAMYGHCIPAKSGHGYWLFHITPHYVYFLLATVF